MQQQEARDNNKQSLVQQTRPDNEATKKRHLLALRR